MAYIYESIQPGLFNFTIPGEDKTVSLMLGSRVLVKQQLAGSYLKVLRFIEEVPDEVQKNESKQQAKVEDKITKVEEVTETKVENVSIEVDDTLKSVEETDKKNKTQQIKKR